jgi:hypothetical protein
VVANGMLAVLFTAAIFLPQGGGWGCLAAVTLPPLAVILCLRTLSRGELGSARLRLVARRSPVRLSASVGYVLAIGGLLVVVATLPGVAFFRAAFAEESRLLVKHTQLSLAQDLEIRAQLLWGQIHGRADLRDGSGRPLRIAAPTGSGGADDSPARQAFRGRAGFLNARIENAWDTYTDFFFGTRAELSANWVELPLVGRTSGWFSRWLAELRPHYNEQDVLTRRTAGLGADDGAWFWTRRSEGSGPARIELVKDLVRMPGRAGLHQLRISTIEPGWGAPSWPWVVVLLGVVGLPFVVTYILADRLLLLRVARSSVSGAVLDPDHPGHPASFGPGRYLLIGPPRSGKSGQLEVGRFARLEEGKFRKVDLRLPEDRRWLEPEQVEGLLRETHLAVVIDSFEYRHEDPAFNAQKLEFLRQLSLDEARTIVVVTSIHPLHFKLAAPTAEKGATPSGYEAVAAAWVELLACFRRLYVQRPWERCEAPEGRTSLRARVLHRSVWRTCSPAEQELLHQVAQGRLISSAQPELASLLDRGLLRRTPALQTADESFRRFILQAYRPGTATPDAVAEPPGLWQHLKGPAVTGLLVMAGFFFATQKEMWNHTVALITTFVAGIGAFAKVFELLPKDRAKPPGAQP